MMLCNKHGLAEIHNCFNVHMSLPCSPFSVQHGSPPMTSLPKLHQKLAIAGNISFMIYTWHQKHGNQSSNARVGICRSPIRSSFKLMGSSGLAAMAALMTGFISPHVNHICKPAGQVKACSDISHQKVCSQHCQYKLNHASISYCA